MMFGADKFLDNFGELSFFDVFFQDGEVSPEELERKMIQKGEQQQHILFRKLIIKLEPFVCGANSNSMM